MKKVLLLVPDGTGVRNYLYASLVSQLKDSCTFSIWTTLKKEAIDEVAAIHDISYHYHQFSLNKESFTTKLYREAARFARLKRGAALFDNETILRFNWKYNPPSLKLKIFNKITRIMGASISGKYASILAFEEKAKKGWSQDIINGYKEELKAAAIDVIFITHQRVFSLMPICIAAKQLGIKIVSCIYSWDNVPKASLGIWADKYVVWSPLMKEQLHTLYPEITQENITITGTPQFEFYSNTALQQSREVFASTYGLDSAKKWICFSGDDVKTSPNDPMYLNDVANAVSHLKMDVQILFRRCPVDFTDRYDKVIKKYSAIIKVADPIWVDDKENWGAIFPKKEDIALLVNVVRHCDVVLNLGSTMAHDFAVFNKPCLYYKYDPVEDKDRSVKDVYNFQHFRSMEGLDAVGFISSKETLGDSLSKALRDPKSIGGDRKKWLERIALHPLEDASGLIAKQILGE